MRWSSWSGDSGNFIRSSAPMIQTGGAILAAARLRLQRRLRGGPRRAGPREHAEEDQDRVMATSLRGAWPCMRADIPRMPARGGGAIERLKLAECMPPGLVARVDEVRLSDARGVGARLGRATRTI